MKKLLFAVFVLAALLSVSCSNEKIDVDVKNTIRYSDLTLSISTTSAYEKYGMSSYQDYLVSNSSVRVGVTSLLYNSNGKLVDTKSSYEKTFGTVSHSYEKLTDGKYTIITFETLVNADNNNKSENWDLVDIDNINTVKISNKRHLLYENVSWQNSVGVSTLSVDITSNQTINVSPSPVGVLLDFSYENFDKSDYKWLGFVLRNTASGYLLDPSLPTSQKYVYDHGYNEKNRWSFRAQFDKFDDTNGLGYSDSEKFYMLESGEIQYCFATSNYRDNGSIYFYGCYPSSTSSSYNFKEGEYYNLYCYYTGSVQTLISLKADFTSKKDQLKSQISQMPLLYKEPYLIWGESFSQVQSYMSEYDCWDETPDSLSSQLFRYTYQGKNKEDVIYYLFTNKSTDLKKVNVFFNPKIVGDNEIVNYLTEHGFKFMKNENADIYYNSVEKSTQARITTNDSGDKLLQFSPYILCKLPNLNWGCSVADVKSYMSGYSLYNDTPEKDGNYFGLYYYGKYQESETDYYFASESTGLSYVNVFFDPKDVGEDEIVSFLIKNGFSLELQEYGESYFLSKDKLTVARFFVNSQRDYIIQYYKYNNANSRQSLSRGLNVYPERKSIDGSRKDYNKSSLNDGSVKIINQATKYFYCIEKR